MSSRFLTAIFALLLATQVSALSMAPEEFHASRQLACVLAQQSLGHLDEREYGLRMHTVLDGFDDTERDNILAKALGYYDGLMFDVDPGNENQVESRLEDFVASNPCLDLVSRTAVSL